ncbi:MAG: hypothetical protein HY437_00440 [Candidatus Magasanikbacteria bacterium]|nr:hypothetical protein [Candidatus Magasanikbacteria bacterium]
MSALAAVFWAGLQINTGSDVLMVTLILLVAEFYVLKATLLTGSAFRRWRLYATAVNALFSTGALVTALAAVHGALLYICTDEAAELYVFTRDFSLVRALTCALAANEVETEFIV